MNAQRPTLNTQGPRTDVASIGRWTLGLGSGRIPWRFLVPAAGLVFLGAAGEEPHGGKVPRLAAAGAVSPAGDAYVPILMHQVPTPAVKPERVAERDRIRESIRSADSAALPTASFAETPIVSPAEDYPRRDVISALRPAGREGRAEAGSGGLNPGWGWLADGVFAAQRAAREDDLRSTYDRGLLETFELVPANPFDAFAETDRAGSAGQVPLRDRGPSREAAGTPAAPGIEGQGWSTPGE
jgi:hypothetical protein